MQHGTPALLVEPVRSRVDTLAGAWLASFKSKATRAAYRDDITRWFAWCDASGFDPLDVDRLRRTHLELYGRQLEDAGRAPTTVHRRMSGVVSFYRWIFVEELVARDPFVHVRRPRCSNESPRTALSRVEMHDLLAQAQSSGGYDYALVALLGLTALRIAEACGADVENLAETSWHHTLTVTRKGGRPEAIALPPQVMHALTAALDGRTAGPLLLNSQGGRMNRQAAARTLERLRKQARISRRVHPHLLRHSAITLALRAGVPLQDVQYMASHRSSNTTLRYARALKTLDRSPAYALAQYVAGAA